MKKWLEIGIVGCSPFIAGIEAILQKQQGLRVRRLGNSLAEATGEVKMLSPHAVIYEMRDAEQPVVAAILRDYPRIKLIGLEPERDSITVFSANEQAVTSVEELARAIMRNAG